MGVRLCLLVAELLLVHGDDTERLCNTAPRGGDDVVTVTERAVVLVHCHESRDGGATRDCLHDQLDFISIVVPDRPDVVAAGAKRLVFTVLALFAIELTARDVDALLERVMHHDLHAILHVIKEADTTLLALPEVHELRLVVSRTLDVLLDLVENSHLSLLGRFF